MSRLIEACIDLAGVLGVIKANASGHGFALLDIADAVHLRETGIEQPIVLLDGIFTADELARCVSTMSPGQAPHEATAGDSRSGIVGSVTD